MNYFTHLTIGEKLPTIKLEKLVASFCSPFFHRLTAFEQFDFICRSLLQWIEEAPQEGFALRGVAELIDSVRNQSSLSSFDFSCFEWWLNICSGLDRDRLYLIRGKIAGRLVPRGVYQWLFPVESDKQHAGVHLVASHPAPDLDTTVASFWGWIDSFAAAVAQTLHIWNLPGEKPPFSVEIPLLFSHFFGSSFFSSLNRSTLSLFAIDLASVDQVEIGKEIDLVDWERAADSIVVDKEGFYLGEWEISDFVQIHSIIAQWDRVWEWYLDHFHQCLRTEWKPVGDINLLHRLSEITMEKCPIEFSSDEVKKFKSFLFSILGVQLQSSPIEWIEKIGKLIGFDRIGTDYVDLCSNGSDLEKLIENIRLDLLRSFQYLRRYLSRRGVVLKIRLEILEKANRYVDHGSHLEEIKEKIGLSSFVTVTLQHRSGRRFPLAIIRAEKLSAPFLGTVSLRDCSSPEEVDLPSFFKVISVIDHHKSNLVSSSPMLVTIANTQSVNTIVAEISFQISDLYGKGNRSVEEIEKQIAELASDLKTPSEYRLIHRLLLKQMNQKQNHPYFVSPEREKIEYLHYICAILDDTDLLSKASPRDLDCLASLLNRLYSLERRKEIEVVHFDDIDPGFQFVENASAKILKNRELYQIYTQIYFAKKEQIERQLQQRDGAFFSDLFVDTKEFYKSCSVGQLKLFHKNITTFHQVAADLRDYWLEQLKRRGKKEIMLYLQLVSTIPDEEVAYSGIAPSYSHHDELWIWIPALGEKESMENASYFLSSIDKDPSWHNLLDEIHLPAEGGATLEQFMTPYFTLVPRRLSDKSSSMIIFYVRPGSLNSRKAMITPHLYRKPVR